MAGGRGPQTHPRRRLQTLERGDGHKTLPQAVETNKKSAMFFYITLFLLKIFNLTQRKQKLVFCHVCEIQI